MGDELERWGGPGWLGISAPAVKDIADGKMLRIEEGSYEMCVGFLCVATDNSALSVFISREHAIEMAEAILTKFKRDSA